MSALTAEQKASRRRLLAAACVSVVLFGLFYLQIWLRVQPRLLYHHHAPLFLTTFGFLKGFLGRPGGVVEYVSQLLAQLNYYPWAGALVITLLAWLICLSTRGLLSAFAGKRIHPAVHHLPLLLLLILYNRYEYHLMTSVGVVATLALVNLYARFAPRKVVGRLATFLVLSVVFYYAAGAMLVLLAVLCGLSEFVSKRRIVLGLVCLLCTAVPAVFALTSYQMTVAQAYAELLPPRRIVSPTFSPLPGLATGIQVALLLFFPLAAVLAGLHEKLGWLGQWAGALWGKLRGRAALAKPAAIGASGVRPHWTYISLAGFLAVAAVLTTVSFDTNMRRRLQIGWHAQQGEWEAVLEAARRLPPPLYNRYIINDVNRALYHTGRLAYDMFTYPQSVSADGLLLFGLRARFLYPTYLKSSATFFELGQVNTAQHRGQMALEAYGQHPEILKQLARINIVKNRPETARTFLGALRHNPLCRRWADDFLRRLDEDPTGASDSELQRLSACMPRTDYYYEGIGRSAGYERILQELLQANRHNRMAFEYLMAWYLSMNQLDKIVANIGRLDDFDYPDIPRHYEQAILIYQGGHPNEKVNLRGRHISKETRDRLRDFGKDYLRYKQANGLEKQAAFRTLQKRHGDTYFFYYTTGYSVFEVKLERPDVVTGATK